jgi:hypothetical protein
MRYRLRLGEWSASSRLGEQQAELANKLPLLRAAYFKFALYVFVVLHPVKVAFLAKKAI